MLDTIKNRFRNLFLKRQIRYGLPFLTFLTVGWLGLQEFARIRYDFKKKFGMTSEFQDKMENAGKTKNKQLSIEEEFEKLSGKDLDDWYNIRGPRPGEDSREIQNIIRQEHANDII